MKIAIPTANGQLCSHFGHCQMFAIVDVDTETNQIVGTEMIEAPPHEPGLLPDWLNQLGCNMVIAGGMGRRAIGFFDQKGINVIIGAPTQRPEEVVTAYLNGELMTGANLCDQSGINRGGRGRSRQ
jgi:predicted Fe-Mo cluster-binding NifX family protein